MRSIHKFPLDEVIHSVTLAMPEGAKILSFQVQYDVPCIWALVDTEAPFENRYFLIFGTGHPFTVEAEKADFIGTVQLNGGSLLIHLFEEKR